LNNLLAVALGGALGALGRYAVSGWTHQLLGTAFPYGTLVVNIAGCFALGFVVHLGQASQTVPETLGIAVRIGFLGALTTFSTFGYETLRQLEDNQWTLGLANIGANVLIGLLAVWAGATVGRLLLGP
jgi:CrcB protein